MVVSRKIQLHRFVALETLLPRKFSLLFYLSLPGKERDSSARLNTSSKIHSFPHLPPLSPNTASWDEMATFYWVSSLGSSSRLSLMDSGNNATSEFGHNFILWVISQIQFVNYEIRRTSATIEFFLQNSFFLIYVFSRLLVLCFYWISLQSMTINREIE